MAGFLSGRVQRAVVDYITGEDVRVVSCVPQGTILGPLLVLALVICRPSTLEPDFSQLFLSFSILNSRQIMKIAASNSISLKLLGRLMFHLMILPWYRDVPELPVFENCSPVRISAAASHLGLLDRVVSKALRLSGGLV